MQSDAFSDIIRPVPNSLHSQPAESSLSLPVPHWVRYAGFLKDFLLVGKRGLRGAGCEGHRRHYIWKGFRPKVKTAGPGIRIGGRSQSNRTTFCFICCRSTTIRGGGQSFSFGGHSPPLPRRWLRAWLNIWSYASRSLGLSWTTAPRKLNLHGSRWYMVNKCVYTGYS